MDAQSPDTEILELRSRIEATYAAEPARARLYAFYNRIEEVLSRGKAKEICGSRYSRDLCQCCEFGDGEQDSMFTGILPWEMSWLKTKKSAFKTEDKFAIHDTGLGLVCTACEAACQMKPVDCAMYPYAFANYTGFTVDIMFSGKCSMEGDPAAKEAHIGHQSPNLADLVELMVEFDARILDLLCRYTPYYQKFERIQTYVLAGGALPGHSTTVRSGRRKAKAL